MTHRLTDASYLVHEVQSRFRPHVLEKICTLESSFYVLCITFDAPFAVKVAWSGSRVSNRLDRIKSYELFSLLVTSPLCDMQYLLLLFFFMK